MFVKILYLKVQNVLGQMHMLLGGELNLNRIDSSQSSNKKCFKSTQQSHHSHETAGHIIAVSIVFTTAKQAHSKHHCFTV